MNHSPQRAQSLQRQNEVICVSCGKKMELIAGTGPEPTIEETRRIAAQVFGWRYVTDTEMHCSACSASPAVKS